MPDGFVGEKEHKPDVTIGFCVRNSERTIKDSLYSILNQDYPRKNTRIVIVDGKSTDRTIEIARRLVGEKGVESEFYSDDGKGLGTARQIMLDHSNGKYVITIDGDVVVSPGFVTSQVKYMESNLEIGVATGRYAHIENTGSSLPELLESLVKYIGSAGYRQTSEYHGLPPNDASIYRTSASKHVGGYDTTIKGAGEDEDIILRIINEGWQISVNNEAKFYTLPRENLKSLWEEHVWFGQGAHFVRHKHRLHTPKPIPLVYFLIGLKDSQAVYRLTGLRESFLLPAYYFFGIFAWWFGYIRAHHSGYGHGRDSTAKSQKSARFMNQSMNKAEIVPKSSCTDGARWWFGSRERILKDTVMSEPESEKKGS